MHRLTINRGDDVSANEPRFVRRTVGCFDAGKRDAGVALGRVKVVNSYVRSRRNDPYTASRHSGDLLDEGSEHTGSNEEDKQTNEHPGRAAYAATALTNFTSGWN